MALESGPGSASQKPQSVSREVKVKPESYVAEKKAPCFLHNVRDWLCSPSIARMSDQQYRAYHMLLNYSWLETPRATLPNDDLELSRLLRLSEQEWDAIKTPILAKFTSDGNGRIFNPRLMEESNFCDKKVAAGKARWQQSESGNGSGSKSKPRAAKKQTPSGRASKC